MSDRIKLFATFLPQYHRDKRNDAWWGAGFTEWDNVKGAHSNFSGHVQPKIPLDGYYDLSDPEEIGRQCELAHSSGLDGFVIYHYWSNGERLLSKPLDLILSNSWIETSFSLCWANHPWTRTWRNRVGALDVLMPQEYGDQNKHFQFLCEVFSDERYSHVCGRPIFYLYKAADIPFLSNWCAEFRGFVKNTLGVDPFLVSMAKTSSDMRDACLFDAICLFQPSAALYAGANLNKSGSDTLAVRLRTTSPSVRKIFYRIQDLLPAKPRKFSYSQHVDACIEQYCETACASQTPIIPMVCVGFDNTPRYKSRATIFADFSIQEFERLLTSIIETKQKEISRDDPAFDAVILNSWNEWGEGMYLQPDAEFGNSKLKVVSKLRS